MPGLASNVVSGSYTATWQAAALGMTEDGFTITWSFETEDVTTDSYGDTVIDSVYRGGNCFVEFTLKEWLAAGVEHLITPWDQTNFGGVGTVGRMAVNGNGTTEITEPLVLTDVDGTPAANASNITTPVWTFHETILDNAHEVTFALNNRHRVIPIRLRCYPTSQSSVVRWWTCSAPA